MRETPAPVAALVRGQAQVEQQGQAQVEQQGQAQVEQLVRAQGQEEQPAPV
jgi:hypothetical protein